MSFKYVVLVVLLGLMAFTSYTYLFDIDQVFSSKIFQTAAIFFFAFIIDILAEKFFLRMIKIPKARFIISKSAGYATYLLAIILTLGIWIEQAQNLLFTFGVIGAGVAIALQKPITNVVGFIVLLVKRPYKPGDRIEIDGEAGDVIDTDLFYTTIMEVGKWTSYDQFTGRIKTMPNSYVLDKIINNYSRDFGFIWEEIMIPVTYHSNIKKARKLMLAAAEKTTKDFTEKSERQLKRMTYKYLLEPRDVHPAIYIVPTDDWVELHLRFIVDAHHRRSYVNPIFEEILGKFSKHKDIRISSRTSARVWDASRTKKEY